MIIVMTALHTPSTRANRPRGGFWHLVGRWVYSGLIGLGTAMAGSWLGDPFGDATCCHPRKDRPVGGDPGWSERHDIENR